MKIKNTLQKGAIRTIIFREGNTWFGVALEFNIVEVGDSPQEVMILLDEAIRGYVISARKAKVRSHILNQTPDPMYEKMWSRLEQHKPIPSPIVVHSFGMRSLVS